VAGLIGFLVIVVLIFTLLASPGLVGSAGPLLFLALAVLAVIFVPAVRRFAIGIVVLAVLGYMAYSAANERYQAARSQVAASVSAPLSITEGGFEATVKRAFAEKWRPFIAGGSGSSCCIQPGDVQQGHLGDCWLLASLAAIARTNPGAIKGAIQSRNDGTYTVTLFPEQNGSLARRDIHINTAFPEYPTTLLQYLKISSKESRFPYAQPGDDNEEAWVMLIERAAALVHGSYEKLDDGSGLEGLQLVTGRKAQEFEPRKLTPDALAAKLTELERNNDPVTAGTFKPNQIVESGPNPLLIGNETDATLNSGHLYYFIHYDPATRKVTVGNQHERNKTNELTLQEFQFAFTRVFYTDLPNAGDGCRCT
jgi:hypothetical protein